MLDVLVAQVRGHDARLPGDGPLDELQQHVGRRGRDRIGEHRHVRLDEVEDHRVLDEPCLDHLGQPGDEVEPLHGLEGRQVAHHSGRGVEGTDEVLPLRGVDRGLPTDRGVDHREQRRRHLDHLDPAQPGRRYEAGKVGRRAAPEPDDRVRPREAGLAQHAPAERRHLSRLGVLGVRHLGPEGLVPVRAEVLEHGVRGRGQGGRVHDEHALDRGAEHRRDGAEQVVADDDVVRLVAADTDGPRLSHGSRRPPPARPFGTIPGSAA